MHYARRTIIIALGKGYQVFKFSPEGKVLMTLGKAGVASAEPSLFDEPTDVAVASNGDIFVTEGHSGGTAGNDRISKFSKDGKFIKSWASKDRAQTSSIRRTRSRSIHVGAAFRRRSRQQSNSDFRPGGTLCRDVAAIRAAQRLRPN
jgi:hypothetical protein